MAPEMGDTAQTRGRGKSGRVEEEVLEVLQNGDIRILLSVTLAKRGFRLTVM